MIDYRSQARPEDEDELLHSGLQRLRQNDGQNRYVTSTRFVLYDLQYWTTCLMSPSPQPAFYCTGGLQEGYNADSEGLHQPVAATGPDICPTRNGHPQPWRALVCWLKLHALARVPRGSRIVVLA